MAHVVAPFENRQAWLKWRKGRIGASDSPIILGLSPHKKPMELFKEKTSACDHEEITNPAIDLGNELEPIAREKFAVWYNFEFNTDEVFAPLNVESESISYMSASLDGISDDKLTIIEIKYQGYEAHESGEIKPHYYAQIQHQLFVSGAKLCYLVSINLERRIKVIAVLPDTDYQNDLIAHCASFWNDMQAGKMASESFDADLVNKFRRWESLNIMLKDLKLEQDGLAKEIFASGVEHCAGFTVSEVSRKGNVDYSKVPQLKDVDLDPYRGANIIYKQIKKAKS